MTVPPFPKRYPALPGNGPLDRYPFPPPRRGNGSGNGNSRTPKTGQALPAAGAVVSGGVSGE